MNYGEAESTFYGGPWDGQIRRVRLHDRIAIPVAGAPEPLTDPAALSFTASSLHFRTVTYRLEKWANGQGAVEWRYYLEEDR